MAVTLLVSNTIVAETVRWLLIIAVVVFPHVAFRLSRRYFNHAKGARLSMLADGFLVGVLIVAMNFNLLVSVCMVTCLVMGTLLICPPVMLLVNLAIVGGICAAFFTPEHFLDARSHQRFRFTGAQRIGGHLVLSLHIYAGVCAPIGWQATCVA